MATLSTNVELPISFKRLINDTFKYCICHCVSIKPPVIIAKCCKNMLGSVPMEKSETWDICSALS